MTSVVWRTLKFVFLWLFIKPVVLLVGLGCYVMAVLFWAIGGLFKLAGTRANGTTGLKR